MSAVLATPCQQSLERPFEQKKGRTRANHEAIVDMLVATPQISRVELAAWAGYTVEYISMITCSDAFQARLAARRTELIDPLIKEEIEARFKAVTQRSLEVLQQKLAAPSAIVSDALLLKAVELGAKGMGVGGFAAVATAAPPQGSSEDRLARLAGRLEALAPGRGHPVQDATIIENAP